MSKTITLRLDDNVYELFLRAASGEKRTISNYIEYATVSHLTSEAYVSNEEMEEILEFSESLKKGLKDVKKGKYEIVK